MKTASNTAIQVERTKFALDLKDTPFDLKPAYEVVLAPNGRKALVYDTVSYDHERNSAASPTPPMKAWRVVAATKSGNLLQSHYDAAGKVFTDPLLVHLYIQQMSKEFNKAKRTTVETTDIDE